MQVFLFSLSLTILNSSSSLLSAHVQDLFCSALPFSFILALPLFASGLPLFPSALLFFLNQLYHFFLLPSLLSNLFFLFSSQLFSAISISASVLPRVI
jgi:hypothetical protein